MYQHLRISQSRFSNADSGKVLANSFFLRCYAPSFGWLFLEMIWHDSVTVVTSGDFCSNVYSPWVCLTACLLLWEPSTYQIFECIAFSLHVYLASCSYRMYPFGDEQWGRRVTFCYECFKAEKKAEPDDPWAPPTSWLSALESCCTAGCLLHTHFIPKSGPCS